MVIPRWLYFGIPVRHQTVGSMISIGFLRSRLLRFLARLMVFHIGLRSGYPFFISFVFELNIITS